MCNALIEFFNIACTSLTGQNEKKKQQDFARMKNIEASQTRIHLSKNCFLWGNHLV